MNTNRTAILPHPLIRKLLGLGAAALLSVATTAGAADVILLADASPTAARPNATPQEVLSVTALRGYDAGIFRELASVARYPNRPEASDARLQGKVTVAFRIDRQGTLQQAEIVETSHSRFLNAAALVSVHLAKYQAIPADVLPGEAGRSYQVTFDYRLPHRD